MNLELDWVMLEHTLEMFHQWGWLGGRGKKEVFFKNPSQGILWGIWKERNKRIFEGIRKWAMEVRDAILCEVGCWMLAFEGVEDVSLNDIMCDWRICMHMYSWKALEKVAM